MRCPKCAHSLPEGKGKCIYCGANLSDAAPVDAMDMPMGEEETLFSEKAGKSVFKYSIIVEEQANDNLSSVSAHLGKKAEEAMWEGGNKIFIEENTRSQGKTKFDFDPGSGVYEKNILLEFGLTKTKRRGRMSPLALMLTFISSGVLVALLVWVCA